MNIKALIKKYEELWNEHSPFYEPVPYTSMIELFLKELKQLDELKPVKVPQFVADVIEGAREQSVELEDAFEYVWEVATGELREWFRKLENRNNFARAWLDGYEVEEEKRYEVILRNGQSLKTVYRQGGDHLDFEMVYGDLESFTRERLEDANFGWVFDCPGIEIEEVEYDTNA
ncbi:phage protein [Streptococcus pneumoniae]|nr:phage protein [Streptococcus pneumoniae]